MGKTEGSRGWAPQWLGARERGRVRAGVGADPVCGAAGVREKGEGEQRSGQQAPTVEGGARCGEVGAIAFGRGWGSRLGGG